MNEQSPEMHVRLIVVIARWLQGVEQAIKEVHLSLSIDTNEAISVEREKGLEVVTLHTQRD